jgi:CheY-like chemotaxis protein
MPDHVQPDPPHRGDDRLREANEQLALTALRSLNEAEASAQRWLDERTLNATLVRKQQLLRTVASQLTLTEHHERKRLAADLHDYLAQMLVVGRLKVGQTRSRTLSDPTLDAMIDEIDHIFSNALSYTRTLMAELSPPVLKDLGLIAALNWLAEQFAKQYALTVDLQVPQEHVSVSEDLAFLLYRSVRELLINVTKHAQTSHVVIAITVGSHDALHIRVTDQGRGFDPLVLDTKTAEEHFGLMSIRERMEAMGGWFQAESAPGRGTTITLGLPLHQAVHLSADRRKASRERRQDLSTQKMSDVHRVLLADDHALVRQGLRAILEGFQDVSIVGEASNGVEAVSLVDTCLPDLILMDVNMPKMDGIEATKHIMEAHPSAIVIGLSVNDSTHIIKAMQDAGAADFVSKDAAAEVLHDTLNAYHPLACRDGRAPRNEP